MNKKGFTLVELLAVIAILAILVIVAMPNVLGMFNQAKANTFVTEVQKYMDNAKNEFIAQAMTHGGKGIVFRDAPIGTTDTVASISDATVVSDVKLSMDGAAKNYIIWLDRNGNFKRVVIYDENFCYDSNFYGAGEGKAGGATLTKGTTTPDGFDKSSVSVDDLVEASTSDVIGTATYTTVAGCGANIKARTE